MHTYAYIYKHMYCKCQIIQKWGIKRNNSKCPNNKYLTICGTIEGERHGGKEREEEKTREIERESQWESDGFINLDPYKYLQFLNENYLIWFDMDLAEEKKYCSNCNHGSVKGIFDERDTIFLQELLSLKKQIFLNSTFWFMGSIDLLQAKKRTLISSLITLPSPTST